METEKIGSLNGALFWSSTHKYMYFLDSVRTSMYKRWSANAQRCGGRKWEMTKVPYMVPYYYM